MMLKKNFKYVRQILDSFIFWISVSKFNSEYIEYLPFIFWLVGISKPKIIVQLGANHPNFYYGYCCAIRKMNTDVHAYIIDVMNGEQQTQSVNFLFSDSLSFYYTKEFKSFSSLIHSTIEDASDHFKDRRVDLLHISGARSIDHVLQVIESWNNKLSDQSVILIDNFISLEKWNDIERIWNRVIEKHPSFSFPYANGLKIIAFGKNYPAALNEFITGAHKAEIKSQAVYISYKMYFLIWPVAKLLRRIVRRLPLVVKCTSSVKKIFKKIKYKVNKQNCKEISRNTNTVTNTQINHSATHHDYPDLFALRSYQPQAKIAVILHIYYPDIWGELRAALQNISEPFDLFVSLVCASSAEIYDVIIKEFPHAIVHIFPNHGRDVLPFILYVNTGVFSNYDAILKLHSKKSLHLDCGDLWRARVYHALAGSENTVSKIIERMRRSPNMGLVGAPNSICDKRYWAGSETQTLELAERIHCRFEPDSLRFIGSTMFWIHPFILTLLKSLNLTSADFQAEEGQLALTTAHHVERLIGILCESAGMEIYEVQDILSWHERVNAQERVNSQERSDLKKSVNYQETDENIQSVGSKNKVIAFYLPQFYPTLENNMWWGKGYTEWTSVTRATPLYDKHDQPKLPADLGFYDLRLTEAREAQAKIAKAYGVYGFCYHYYWFDLGKKILDYPLKEVVRTGQPDLPFCICWANGHWTRRWDGLDKEILLEQKYSYDICKALIHDLFPVLSDPRYIRFNHRPVIVIHRLLEITNYKNVCEMWREECIKVGIGEIHIAAVDWGIFPGLRFQGFPKDYGVDAFIDMPPLTTKASYGFSPKINKSLTNLSPDFKGDIFDYDLEIDFDIRRYQNGYRFLTHRGLMVGFDNTPRRKHLATIFHGTNPAKFRRWLAEIIKQNIMHKNNSENLIFVQAWNEWAEGNMLEPTHQYDAGYLEAIRSCMVCQTI